MSRHPRCIRCNRPIRDAEPRQSRMGATRRSYWHTRDEDCVDTGAHRRRAANRARGESRDP